MTCIVMAPGTDNKPGGGVARHVYEISKRIGRKGFQVVNVKPSAGKSPEACLVDDAYVLLKMPVSSLRLVNLRLDKISRLLESALSTIHYREAVKKVLGTLDKPLIIHTHGFCVISQPRGTSKDYRRVATLHGFVPTDMTTKEKAYTGAAILNKLLRRFYKNADRYTAISERIKSMAFELYGIEENRITVAPHGVDTRFFSKKVSSEEIEKIERRFKLDKPHRVLFLGQLDEGKRPDVLLRALKVLSSKRDDVQLVIRSSWGDYYYETLRLIRALGLDDKVRLIKERVFGADLRALYKASCAFVNPYHLITGPSTAVLEAMASGTPPIIYKHSSNREMVDQSSGVILEKIDPIELANAIELLVEDEIFAKRLGHNSMNKMINEYDWDNVVVPRYVSTYDCLT